MRNHPAERARQIAAVERAGHDPRVGTWPGDPGGPSAEARLEHVHGFDPTTEACGGCGAEMMAEPGENAAATNRATRKHERDARREHLEEVLGGPEPAPATVDSATFEREAYAADRKADRLAADADRARAEAELLRDMAVMTDGEGFALCPVCGAGTSDCQTHGCGIAPEDALNVAVLDRRANDLASLADTLEAQAGSHADRVAVLRDRAEEVQDRADGAA